MARSPQEPEPVRVLPDPQQVPRPWLGSYPPGVPPTYRYADVSPTRFLEDAARDFPAVPATWFDGVTLDYAQLRTQVVRFAAGLRACGVDRGDRVVVACPDLPALPIALFAVWRLGGVVVLVEPGADDVGEVASATEAVLVVGDRRALEATGTDLGVELVAVRARDWLAPTRRTLIAIRRWWPDRGRPGRAFTDLLETGVDVPVVDVGRDAPAVIVHRGGTPVVHTHASLVAGAFQARLWVPDVQAGKERLLIGAPATGAFGLTAGLLAGVLSAATLVLPRGRDPGSVLSAAERARPGLALLEPELAEAVASEAGRLAAVRAALVDGPVPDESRRRFEVLGGVRLRPVHVSVAAGFVLAAPVYGRTGPDGAMLPVTDTLAVVVAEHDPSRLVAEGEAGRLAVNGPQLPAGVADARGWLLTSDLAVPHADGWLRLVAPDAHHNRAGGVA